MRETRWKRPMFVVETAVLQAVMELIEDLVEQMTLCLLIPVPGGAASVEGASPGQAKLSATRRTR